jgi:hypothetical protein
MNAYTPSRNRVFLWVSILVIALIVILVAGLVRTQPIRGEGVSSVTPGVQAAVSPLPPETLCALMHIVGTQVPPEVRARNDPAYYACVEARKSPVVPGVGADKIHKMGIPTLSPPKTVDVPRRPAGIGTIVEDSPSGYSSNYLLENEWREVIGDKLIRVFAGALQGNGIVFLPRPWQGLVIVEVRIPNTDAFVAGESGFFNTPSKVGSVKIVDAQGERLVLRAEDGTTFYFDVPARRFVSSLTEVVPTATPAPATPQAPAYP